MLRGAVTQSTYEAIDVDHFIRSGGIPSGLPRGHAAQHPAHLVEADAAKLHHGFVLVLIRIQHQHDRRVERHKPANPGTEIVSQLDTERARNVRRREIVARSGVNNECVRRARSHIVRLQLRNRVRRQRLRSQDIDRAHEGVVLRIWLEPAKLRVGKRLQRWGAARPGSFASPGQWLTLCGPRRWRCRTSLRRASGTGRAHQAAAPGDARTRTARSRAAGALDAQEIGAARGADEQTAAGEERRWMAIHQDQVAHVLGRVAGRVEWPNGEAVDPQFLEVEGRCVVKRDACASRQTSSAPGGARARGRPKRSRCGRASRARSARQRRRC